MLVKICGIQTIEAAWAVVEGGADFIGFVFAESRRKVDPKAAQEIVRCLPDRIKKVGVFVNESIERMIEIAETVGLDYLQLHGDEPASLAEKLPYPIIKAFPADMEKIIEMKDYPCEYYLIDSPSGKVYGGTGKTFDWNILKNIGLDHQKLFLAGGLTPENVQEAMEIVSPIGVDVSSGVETAGKKDVEKIYQFIKQAKVWKG